MKSWIMRRGSLFAEQQNIKVLRVMFLSVTEQVEEGLAKKEKLLANSWKRLDVSEVVFSLMIRMRGSCYKLEMTEKNMWYLAGDRQVSCTRGEV